MRMKRTMALALLLTGAFAASHGAGLSIPEFCMLTNGRLNDAGVFALSTRVEIDMLIEGGAKFDAWLKLGFRSSSMEDYLGADVDASGATTVADIAEAIDLLESRLGFGLRTAAVSMKGLFGTPLEASLFVGHLDSFCSGSDFPALFGAEDFTTRFKGYMYYPDGVGGDPYKWYDGIHEAFGTGARLSLGGDSWRTYLYAYQDSWIGAGTYSTDARFLLDLDMLKLEAFLGASFPVSKAGVYRGGLLFYYDTGVIGDFYAQIGIPRWDPTEAFGMDALYFMFEPRVDFGIGHLALNLFFHPAWYLQDETDEAGAMELRADLGFGDRGEGRVLGGAEAVISYNPNLDTDLLVVEAAPYLQTLRDGVELSVRLGLRAFPFPSVWYGMFMPSVGITTAF